MKKKKEEKRNKVEKDNYVNRNSNNGAIPDLKLRMSGVTLEEFMNDVDSGQPSLYHAYRISVGPRDTEVYFRKMDQPKIILH